MRVVFIGASRFGLRCLEATASSSGIELVGVVTAPRSFKISYSREPVTNVLHTDFARVCQKLGAPAVELREKMTDPLIMESIRNWAADFILVAGWYHMIPKAILDVPPKGVAGIHASLLPRYRGGAPLVWAMINGEKEVGATLFYFDEGVDTGDIIAQKSVPVLFHDTIATVYDKIEVAGLEMLRDELPRIADNTAKRTPQGPAPQGHRRVWPQRSPSDGLIDWSQPAASIYNFIRAQTMPYPGAFTFWRGTRVIIWESRIHDGPLHKGAPGEVLDVISEGTSRGMLVATLDDDKPLLITKAQCGSEPQDGAAFALASEIRGGELLGG